MSKFLSKKLSIVIAVSFVAFLSFTYCTAQANETKYLFYGFDLAVVAATNQSIRSSDEPFLDCTVYSRNVSTMEPPKASPVIVTFSNFHDSDIPFYINCIMGLSEPTVIICPLNETPTRDGRCREVANDQQ